MEEYQKGKKSWKDNPAVRERYLQYLEIICNRLLDIREKKGNGLSRSGRIKKLPTREMARIMHISRSAYSKIETGSQLLSVFQLMDLCNDLHCSSDYMLGFTDQILTKVWRKIKMTPNASLLAFEGKWLKTPEDKKRIEKAERILKSYR